MACIPVAAAQTSPATAPPAGSAGPPLSHAIFPLSQVQRGQQGVAYTVLQGSTPEPIHLVIIGVLHDAIGPGRDMILARLVGTKAEYVGVAAGMSGSPVYIDGKLAGAIGYRIGQFTKQPIAGITPIEQMLQVFGSKYNKDNVASHIISGERDHGLAAALPASSWSPGGDVMRPIETPLVFQGFSPAAIQLFRQRLPSLGLTPVSGLGGASPNEIDTAPIVPGSAISAIIVSGDFNMAASCTVTYVDPKRLLACGHPITHFGGISLPMTKAVVLTTIASASDPMKVIDTTQTIGSFTQDRESGILGVFGRPAHMIPVTLAIHGVDQPHIYHFAVVDHPRLTAASLVATVLQAMQDTNGYDDPSTYSVRGEIAVDGYPPVRMNEWVAPTAQQGSAMAVALSVEQRFERIFSNPRELPSVRSVSLDLDAVPGQQSATLADANVLNPAIHAGDRLTIEALLHPYRQPARVVRLTAQLPDSLPPGPVRLLVSGGNTLDHTLHLIPNPSAPPPSLAATINRLNQMHPTNRIYVTLLAPVPQAISHGHDLPAVPLSMANILQPDENGSGFTIDGETAVPLGSQKLNLALTGSHIITLDVQP